MFSDKFIYEFEFSSTFPSLRASVQESQNLIILKRVELNNNIFGKLYRGIVNITKNDVIEDYRLILSFGKNGEFFLIAKSLSEDDILVDHKAAFDILDLHKDLLEDDIEDAVSFFLHKFQSMAHSHYYDNQSSLRNVSNLILQEFRTKFSVPTSEFLIADYSAVSWDYVLPIKGRLLLSLNYVGFIAINSNSDYKLLYPWLEVQNIQLNSVAGQKMKLVIIEVFDIKFNFYVMDDASGVLSLMRHIWHF
ncbi:MAG: TBC1 domain member 8B, partial [Marteilia pararefringens]